MKRITVYFTDGSAPVTIQEGELTSDKNGALVFKGDGATYVFFVDKIRYIYMLPNETN